MILGAKEPGRQRDGAFDHSTGHGWVKGSDGHYKDAIFVKRSRVVPFIVEAYGGIAPHSLAHGNHLARRAKGKYATDRTRYGPHRGSPKSFIH